MPSVGIVGSPVIRNNESYGGLVYVDRIIPIFPLGATNHMHSYNALRGLAVCLSLYHDSNIYIYKRNSRLALYRRSELHPHACFSCEPYP